MSNPPEKAAMGKLSAEEIEINRRALKSFLGKFPQAPGSFELACSDIDALCDLALAALDRKGSGKWVPEELKELDAKATQGDIVALLLPELMSERMRQDANFLAALVNYWRSGGAELVRDFEWLTKAKLVTVQTKDKLFSIDGARLSAVLRVARKEGADRE